MKEERLLPMSAFVEALSVALNNLSVGEDVCNNVLQDVLAGMKCVQNRPCKIAFIKGKDADECVVLENVAWLEADGSYTKFHCSDGKTHMLTANLVSSLRQLVSNGWDSFIRIHKSYAVNIHHIKSKIGNILRVGKTELAIGRTYREFFGKCFFSLSKLA